jgi:hypothetical protein
MSIGNLPDNKLMSLALQGYGPFQPDVGIFCGGYQGPLYPNPTTLVGGRGLAIGSYPTFNPYLYTNPIISTYQMSNNYDGLGVGNPGIDYKNGGHILGLIDTFARMSYGIGVLQAIYDGNDGTENISPAINISIPIISISEEGATTLGTEDIYPFLCEVPTDWLNGFAVAANGRITPDPRKLAQFPSPGGGHTPSTNPIDEIALNDLFGDKTVLSYIGMPQYLRTVIESLSSVANNLSNKTELEFTLSDAAYFNQYCHQSSFFAEPPDEHYERTSEGKCYVQCIVQEPELALKTLTGSSDYHDGVNGQNEYRSLTELNSVVNLVPLLMVGATYWTDTKGYHYIFPPGDYIIDDQSGRAFIVASYMIADLVINVSDVPIDFPGTVTIEGEATVHSLITDPTAYYYTETRRLLPVPPFTEPGEIITTEFGCAQSLRKNIDIEMSATNEFTWDKSWLGGPLERDRASFSDEIEEDTPTGGAEPGTGFVTLDQSDLVVPFSKVFTLNPGCTSIRMRAFIRNRHTMGQDGFTPSWLWVPVEYCHDHGLIIYQPGWHCHYPAGVHYNGWSGDPDDVPNDLASPNIELSFTVTGTNMNPIVCEVSI